MSRRSYAIREELEDVIDILESHAYVKATVSLESIVQHHISQIELVGGYNIRKSDGFGTGRKIFKVIFSRIREGTRISDRYVMTLVMTIEYGGDEMLVSSYVDHCINDAEVAEALRWDPPSVYNLR